MASSKSLASSGSIVNVVVVLKSKRREISLGVISRGIFLAFSSRDPLKVEENPPSISIEFISVSCSLESPKMLVIFPTGFLFSAPQLVIVT